MERRVLLAVILSMAVLYAYQAFVAPPPQPPKAGQQPSGAKPGPAAPAPSPAAVAPQREVAPAPRAVVSDNREHETVVETADVEAVLTNRGGRVVHWRLKHFLDEQGKPVDLV